MKFDRERGVTEWEEFSYILMFVVSSIMALVAVIYIVLDKLDWPGFLPSVRLYDILLTELVCGAILVFAYALLVTKRGVC